MLCAVRAVARALHAHLSLPVPVLVLVCLWCGVHLPRSFKACYDTVQAELENRAAQHNNFSANLVSEIATPILNFVKEKELTRKKMVLDGKKLTKEMSDSLAALAHAKSNYMSKCKIADANTGQYQKAKAEGSIKPKELNKLNAKASKAAEAARSADQEYHKFLKKANDKQRKFYEKEMPKLLDVCRAVSCVGVVV
jgi:hypothetical protein